MRLEGNSCQPFWILVSTHNISKPSKFQILLFKSLKMPKRKREDVPEDEPDPVPFETEQQAEEKRGLMVRSLKKVGVHQKEGNGDPTPQQPAHTSAKPGPSTDPDPDPTDTVTYPSDEEHWKKSLLAKHRKRLYFSRKRM